MTTELHALLWSKKSNCFHIEPLSSTVKTGQRFFRTDSTNDYLVIDCGTRDYCGKKSDELRPVLREREEVRRLYGTE